MRVEQRRDIRFLAQDDVIVALRNGAGVARIGSLKDIGLGGLAFEHIQEDTDSKHPGKKIFLMVNEFCLPNLPCRVIYDVPVGPPDEYSSLLTQFVTRRCGIQFEALTEDQKAQLHLFLKTYTKNAAPEPGTP